MISTRGLPAHVLQEMVSYVVFVVGCCEHGDDYSEAKIITELCALAHSSVASQYITRFQLPYPYVSMSLHLVTCYGFQPMASYKLYPITLVNEVSQCDDIIVSWAGFVNIILSHRRTK